jgi:hypothetical protein
VTNEKVGAAVPASLALHYPCFFVAQPLEGGSLEIYLPFVIQQCSQCRVGNAHSAKKLQSGSVSIEFENSLQAFSVSQLDVFVNQPSKVTPHRTLKFRAGLTIRPGRPGTRAHGWKGAHHRYQAAKKSLQ